MTTHLPSLSHSYSQLPEEFYSRQAPEQVRVPAPLRINEELARDLGIDPKWLASQEGAEFLAGNLLPDDGNPIALVYAGHQFGNWVPRLGDGRATLLGEVRSKGGELLELQYKGSGRTPYSRSGDGRAPLGPVLREFMVSEGMHALGVPTTRVLGAASTGEKVYRVRPLPGAVLIRVAQSHIRIGTFEYFAAQQNHSALKHLVKYTLDRHYEGLNEEDQTPIGLLRAYAERLARLIARWQSLGFIHGVMNTDNMLLSGETVDYGPCAFMNEYDSKTVFSSIDQFGRYAYGNQPRIAQWNLARFAEALSVFYKDEKEAKSYIEAAQEVITEFPSQFEDAYFGLLLPKAGIEAPKEEDPDLIREMVEMLEGASLDYTLFFRHLTALAGPKKEILPPSFQVGSQFDSWIKTWEERLNKDGSSQEEQRERQEKMIALNPVFIPRNHLVEEALDDAVEEGSLAAFDALLEVVRSPFSYAPDRERYGLPPKPEERVAATFCGT